MGWQEGVPAVVFAVLTRDLRRVRVTLRREPSRWAWLLGGGRAEADDALFVHVCVARALELELGELEERLVAPLRRGLRRTEASWELAEDAAVEPTEQAAPRRVGLDVARALLLFGRALPPVQAAPGEA